RLAEVPLRRRLHAVEAGAQVDLVQVQLEDVLLAEFVLEPRSETDFADLAGELLRARELLGEDVPSELHRDRAEPFPEGQGRDVAPDRTRDAAQVHAAMLPETPILDGDEAVAEHGGDLFVIDDDAALGREVGDQRAIHGEHPARLRWPVIPQCRDVGTIRTHRAEEGRREAERRRDDHGCDDVSILDLFHARWIPPEINILPPSTTTTSPVTKSLSTR